MFKRFYPDCWVDRSWNIDYEDLYERGYRGVIFDIDNTLAVHDGPAPEKTMELFDRLRRIGFATCLVSNNDEERVRLFAVQVDSPYIYKADKPSVKGYEKAMARMGTDRGSTVSVGDQLFTDIWGSRRAGLYSILVEPIHPKEEIQIVLKRRLEAVVLHFYKKAGGEVIRKENPRNKNGG